MTEQARVVAAWREVLRGLSAPTPLGFERPPSVGRPAPGGSTRDTRRAQLPLDLAARLRARDAADQPRARSLAAGAWALLLSRAAREDDVLFACARDVAGLVPLRVTIDDALPRRTFLARLQQDDDARRAAGLLSWPDYASCSALPSGATLCESAVFVDTHVGGEWPFALAVDLTSGALTAEFDPRRVDPLDAERLLKRFVLALAALMDAPDEALGTLDLVTPEERARCAAWNRTNVDFRPEATLGELFAEQVARAPDTPAVVSDEGTLSYAELDRRANRLAHRLRRIGVGPDVPVGLCLERGLEALVALVGIVKAGGAYLALEPAYPPERIAFMLRDARSPLVITQASLRLHLREAKVETLVLEHERAALLRERDDSPQTGVGAHHLAYLAYTSGSTGQPKGAEIPQRAVKRLVCAADFIHFGPDETFLHAAPLAFDASTLEVWGALLHGGRVVPHAEPLPTPRGLRATIERHGVTTAWLTAALFNAVVDADPTCLRGLRQLLTGGEALSPDHVRRALLALPETRLYNGYGPTECTTFTTVHEIPRELPAGARSIPIGRAIRDTQLHVLDEIRRTVPLGFVGELYVGGAGLARGYLGRPELTAERFIEDPFGPPGARLYRTGDLVRQLDDGALDYLGRADTQLKVRGFRIEPGEIESALLRHPAVKSAVVGARDTAAGDKRLLAWLVTEAGAIAPGALALRAHLLGSLPEYMLPAAFVFVQALPRTLNGKVDLRALPEPGSERPADAGEYVAPRGALEQALCTAFAETLGFTPVGTRDAFFELGGTSLLALRLLERLRGVGHDVPVERLFQHPTVASLGEFLQGAGDPLRDARRRARPAQNDAREPIAIVGLAGRFPGADDVETLWRHLLEGIESITTFAPDELDPSLAAESSHPDYVPARGVLADVAGFDAAFFGIPPREAELMDPQQRLFLEVAWEALESAGHVPDSFPGPIGVFGGMYNATYFQRHVQTRPDLIEKVGAFQVMVANEKDYVATRTAHRLNLTGPAVSVHTACSTSLVAVCQALDALRGGSCDLALAGGVAVTCPPRSGYLYQEGAMLARDGRTRPFDADASGTVFSDGVAIVALRRLTDAQRDGDHVYAVILAGAINNDGAHKASFTAPSIDGQAAVIAAAHAAAGVPPRSISYVEAHGTATPLGDPIEVAALTRAFRLGTDEIGFCGLGSVKSNLGHLVIAAGATGLIKTALALHHEILPATLHFRRPNPKIDFESSPFHVVDSARVWTRGETPRRAGVSSFGVGGTNAHVVLEEAPPVAAPAPGEGPRLLLLAARSAPAVAAASGRLGAHLRAHPEQDLSDVAFTLHAGRQPFAERRAVVAADADEAARLLETPAPSRRAPAHAPPVVFLFPGQGAQYVGMGRGLYASQPVFRDALDACATHVEPVLGRDLRVLLFDETHDQARAAEVLRATSVTQPALFAVEYALACLWRSLGVEPEALIGHSVGEFVCATLAGVMALEDAARLVAVRGLLMQQQPAGAMLSVRQPAREVEARLSGSLAVASDNGPSLCVVAGPDDEVTALEQELERAGVAAKRLHTSHAFHSPMMEPAVEPFAAHVRAVELRAPRLPFVSTATGTWITADQAGDPMYWARHLRATVRFADGVRTLLEQPERLLLEVGPRATLSTLARQQGRVSAVASLGDGAAAETRALLAAAGQLWCAGVALDAARLHGARRRVPLPTYPFEHLDYWIEAGALSQGRAAHAEPAVPPRSATAPAPASPSAATAPAPHVGDVPAAFYGPPWAAFPTAEAWSAAFSRAPEWPAQAWTSDLAPLVPPAAHVGGAASQDESPMPSIVPTSVAPDDRRERLIPRLAELFEEVSGVEIALDEIAVTFMELGLDSLTLTQVAQQLHKSFGVKVSFRQLMEDFASLERLAEYMDQQMPPDTPAAAAPAAAASSPSPAASPTAAAAAAWGAPPPGYPPPGYVPSGALPPQMQMMMGYPQLPMMMPMPMPGLHPALLQAALEPLLAPLRQQLAHLQAQLGGARAVSVSPATPAPATPATPAPAAAEPATDEPAARAQYDAKKAFGAIARIHLTRDDTTPKQRARLEALTARYTARTAQSKAFTQEQRAVLADPRVVTGFKPAIKELVYPVVVTRSKGARVWDLDGNEYVDVLSGFGCNYFGWQPDFINDAVKLQLDTGLEIGPQTPLAAEVARLVCEFTGFDRAGFCNTGSEAVMGCMRIARTVTGRDTIAIFTGSYHGIFDEVIVRGTKKLRAVPAAPGILPATAQNVLVLDYGTPESLAILTQRAGELAAIMVEPVQSRRPDFQPREYLHALRELCDRSGCVYIFDEVITGFRTGPGGAPEQFGLQADLASYGKVVGGGHPIGIIAGKKPFMDALDGGFWRFGDDSTPTAGVTYFAGTFVRHPLALAAAKAVLLHLKAAGPALQEDLNRRTAAFAEELNTHFQQSGVPLKIKHFSSLWKLFYLDEQPFGELLFPILRDHDVHILEGFPCFFTTAHGEAEVRFVTSAFKQAVAEMQESDFLPGGAPQAPALDAQQPPVPGARLGRDAHGAPAWFVPHPEQPGKYLKVSG